MYRVLGGLIVIAALFMVGNTSPLSAAPRETGGVWNVLLQIQPPADANSLYLNYLNCGWHSKCEPEYPDPGPALDWDDYPWGNRTQFRYSAFLFNSWDTSLTVADWIAQDASAPGACLRVRVRITSASGGLVGDQYNLHSLAAPGSGVILASKSGYHASFVVGTVATGDDPYCDSDTGHTHQEFWPGSAVTSDSTNHWYQNPSDEQLGRNVLRHTEPIYMPIWTVEFHN